MRRVLPACALVFCLLGTGCATRQTSGGLWALDEAHLEEELVYRVPGPQRAAQARQYQLLAADDLLATDASRLQPLLASCPEPRQDRLEPSPAARARDAVRARQDPDRSRRVGQLAAADWYLRRAATTGQASFCERARQALAGTGAPDGTLQLADGQVQLQGEGAAAGGEVLEAADPYQALAAYGLGLVDVVRGPAPLVGHLAAVYGGALDLGPPLPEGEGRGEGAPEEVVDRLAPGLDWEPDGLYAALRAAR